VKAGDFKRRGFGLRCVRLQPGLGHRMRQPVRIAVKRNEPRSTGGSLRSCEHRCLTPHAVPSGRRRRRASARNQIVEFHGVSVAVVGTVPHYIGARRPAQDKQPASGVGFGLRTGLGMSASNHVLSDRRDRISLLFPGHELIRSRRRSQPRDSHAAIRRPSRATASPKATQRLGRHASSSGAG